MRTHRPSRLDSAHHRSSYDQTHPVARGAKFARNLVHASIRPLRALEALIFEIDRVGVRVNPIVLAQARVAWEGGRRYLEDETGDVWR